MTPLVILASLGIGLATATLWWAGYRLFERLSEGRPARAGRAALRAFVLVVFNVLVLAGSLALLARLWDAPATGRGDYSGGQIASLVAWLIPLLVARRLMRRRRPPGAP